jgi:Arc/MetJ family transcription regulator
MRYLQDDESKVVLRFLFLSMAMAVIKQDMKHVESGPFKIKEPYRQLLENMMLIAGNERNKLRKIMMRKNMQVVRLDKNDSFSTYLLVCNGIEEKRNFFNPAIRKKVEEIVRELMQKALLPSRRYVSSNN